MKAAYNISVLAKDFKKLVLCPHEETNFDIDD